MSGNEPIRRGGTPISANNPFRQSMLMRSESPFDDAAASASAPRTTPPAPASSTRRVSSNPFDSEQDSEAPKRAPRNDLPPPYDDRRRANSDSSALGESEKDRLARRYEDSSRRPAPRDRPDRPERSERSDRDRERRYREERNRLRAERDRLRAERDHLRAERHRKEGKSGEHRHRSSNGGSGSRRTRERSKSESSKNKAQDGPSLDVIDKMDVTGLFGPGSFHHDGPFDACTPHRNRDVQQGPVAAFPANGPNNSLAMENPELTRFKQEQVVFGRDPDADPVFPDAADSFDPTERAKPVHGTQTMGLGSTTFVNGTPASAQAMADANHDEQVAASMGRTRSILRRRPDPRGNELATQSSNPERPTSYLHDDEKPSSGLLGRVKSLRISRR